MSKVDWSLAPFATHLTDVPGDFYRPVFWRVVDGVALEAWSVNKDYTKVSDHFTYGPEGCLSYDDYTSIARPTDKPWSGPEDGLPPIGSVCEVENPLEDGQWCKVKILAWDAECAVFQAEADYPYVYDGQGVEGFRKLRTPEQLRETAIRELMDIAQVDCRVTAARLVDAGFKREVV